MSATLNIKRCKHLSTRVRLHPGSVCLDMFVNGLAVTLRQGGFTGHWLPSTLLHQGKNNAEVASSMNYVMGREYLSDEITVNMLELRLLFGKVVLALHILHMGHGVSGNLIGHIRANRLK